MMATVVMMMMMMMMMATILVPLASGTIILHTPSNDTYNLYNTEAVFGGDVDPDSGLTAQVFAFVPLDGCSPLNATLPSSGPWIALLERGNCPFTQKCKAAQNAGAVAAVVFDDSNDDPIVMNGEDDSITIPSVFVSRSDGNLILSYAQQNGTRLTILENDDDYNLWPIVALPLLIILFFCVCMLGIYIFVRRRPARVVAMLMQLSEVDLRAIPVRVYKPQEGQAHDTCPICIDDFKRGDEQRTLPCSHTFHSDCIVPWLNIRRTCPVCKRIITFNSSTHVATATSAGETTPLVVNRSTSINGAGAAASSNGSGSHAATLYRSVSTPAPAPFAAAQASTSASVSISQPSVSVGISLEAQSNPPRTSDRVSLLANAGEPEEI